MVVRAYPQRHPGLVCLLPLQLSMLPAVSPFDRPGADSGIQGVIGDQAGEWERCGEQAALQ